MILSVAKIGDFDQFWGVFSTKGAAKRKEYGSKGSHVFRDPDDPNRIIVVFDWDQDQFDEFVKDPDMAAIFKEGGLQGQPQRAEHAGEHEA